MLNREQLDEYQRDGFLIVQGLFSASEAGHVYGHLDGGRPLR
jgi:hypothetical protein